MYFIKHEGFLMLARVIKHRRLYPHWMEIGAYKRKVPNKASCSVRYWRIQIITRKELYDFYYTLVTLTTARI